MKIFVSHSKDLNYIDDLYRPVRESELDKLHEFFLPHEDSKSVNTKDIIQNSDLVLAEVSLPVTGQGIELGWADAFNVPIACISREGNKISGSLKYITHVFETYNDVDEMIEKMSFIISNVSKESN